MGKRVADMTPKERERKRERQREYYEANREQRREYYEANRERIRERRREHYEANRERDLERKREYREANRERIRERQRERDRSGGVSRRGEPWTDAEDSILCDPVLTRVEMAYILDRSVGSVGVRIKRLRLKHTS